MDQGENRSATAPCFDRERALSAMDGDVELLREIAGLFLEDCPRQQGDLGAAVAARDADSVSRAAHALKGSVSALAALRATELAGEVERLGRAGDLDAARGVFEEFQEELQRVIAALESLAAE